jgi:leucine dehydrogenase
VARVYQLSDDEQHYDGADLNANLNHQPVPLHAGAGAATLKALHRMIDDWEGLAVAVTYHRLTGSWIFIAFHDVTLGPAVGGCRINIYQTPIAGLQDAMRLAEGMTFKWATLGARCGGGKAVLALPAPLNAAQRVDLVRCFGQTLERLQGAFWTGGDLGTTPTDLENLKQATRYLHCFDAATGRQIDSGIYTALGVAAAIRVAIKHVFGSADLSGRAVLVQGIGQVGSQLARILNRAGARVLVSDLNGEKSEKFQAETGCGVIPP